MEGALTSDGLCPMMMHRSGCTGCPSFSGTPGPWILLAFAFCLLGVLGPPALGRFLEAGIGVELLGDSSFADGGAGVVRRKACIGRQGWCTVCGLLLMHHGADEET